MIDVKIHNHRQMHLIFYYIFDLLTSEIDVFLYLSPVCNFNMSPSVHFVSPMTIKEAVKVARKRITDRDTLAIFT